jgi:AAA15 family ATPase/GTPase
VYDEWLYATPKGKQKQKTQAWFERNKKKPINKNVIAGDKAVWLRATRENALFLSTAVQLNSEDFKKPFDWIRSRLRVLPRPETLSPSYTFRQIHENDKKDFVLRFMKGLDASFDDIVIEEKEFTEHDLPKEMSDEIKQLFFKDTKNIKRFEVHTVHKIEEGGHYQLPLNEESAGTKRLLAFAGPILDVFEKGCALVVDEIHNSLHPLALKGIISLFHDKEINNKNAQLIFTTHDTNTMNYLERDQIWLLDKGKFGNTTFTSLSEFQGKADEPIEKRYLGGRYGALPNIEGII